MFASTMMWSVILPFYFYFFYFCSYSEEGLRRGLPALTSLLTCFFSFVYFYA